MPACAACRLRTISIPNTRSRKPFWRLSPKCAGWNLDGSKIGIDGCSAPNFAIPLSNAALGFARLCDPRGLSQERAAACRRITSAMMANPVMVSGAGRFDTRLMEVCSKRIVAKGRCGRLHGSWGFWAEHWVQNRRGLGSLSKSPMGTCRCAMPEGNFRNRVRPAVALEILKQLGYISEKELEALAEFGPVKPVTNARKIVVGEARPAFSLKRE